MAAVFINDLPKVVSVTDTLTDSPSPYPLPSTQQQLLLHGKGQRYQVHDGCEIPRLGHGDLLVEIYAIGLNPIDWKSA